MRQAIEFEANLDQQLSRFVGAIPVLIPIFRKLNVVSIINRYCPCQADVDYGYVALILALNRLMSPRPLYKVADWMVETVLEAYLQKNYMTADWVICWMLFILILTTSGRK